LPGSDFIYGISNVKLDGGVPEALQHWINLAKDSKAREERYKLVRDFIALNREAIKSGCVTTKQNNQFRELNDIRRKVRIDNGASSVDDVKRNKTVFPADMVFGMPHRPSTPINSVLEHKYLRDWLDEMERIEAEKIAAKREASVRKFIGLIGIFISSKKSLEFFFIFFRKQSPALITPNQVG
jgi:hypothetical protein